MKIIIRGSMSSHLWGVSKADGFCCEFERNIAIYCSLTNKCTFYSFSKFNKKVHLLVSEKYMDSIMHGATIKEILLFAIALMFRPIRYAPFLFTSVKEEPTTLLSRVRHSNHLNLRHVWVLVV